jgi:GR25 family glycosyltransferase involved in LPS biosynthesis
MTREEIAVALSHIKTWQQIADDEISYALVLEDDVFFEKTFATQLNRSWQELPERRRDGFRFDILYLSYREVERGAQRVWLSPNLIRPIRGYWWLSGYVLSCSAAQDLLQSLPVIGPVDMWMNLQFSELDVYSTPSSVISQRTDLQSDNRYSILPLLSQLGIQSDKTHMVLEKTKGRRPVFAMGFDRRGADLLEAALSLLGYRCCNDRWGRLSGKIGRLIDDNSPLLFDAYIGTRSVTKAFRRLDESYSKAVFILPRTLPEGSKLSPKELKEIASHFASRSDKLLRLDIRYEDDWHNLCEFLCCDTPHYPFPRNEVLRGTHSLMACELIPLRNRSTIVLEHDVHSWIVPYERLSAFGILSKKKTHGNRTGAFKTVIEDEFASFDDTRWTALEDSFPSNLAMFRRENVAVLEDHGCRMTLMKQRLENKGYSSASLKSNQSYQYGRFEATIKPAKAAGVITAFFLHRSNPWQEIDVEILGCDTTKLLTNVYFNPGDDGTNCNYGNRGTPIMIDLTFDAAEDYHRYAIEWEPQELRWFVDDELIYVRSVWEPTPIPNLPMGVYCSTWPPKSTELAGELRDCDLPVCSYVRSIGVSTWYTTSHNPERPQFEHW